MRRRIWLVLLVALPLAIASSIWALRQPRIYQAVAEVTIDAPEYDPMLSTLVSHEIGRHDTHAQESYIPNLTAMLRSKTLAELVVSRPEFASDVVQFDDPAFELILDRLQVRPIIKSNMLVVSLEGKDPARTKKLLEGLLFEFKNMAERGNREREQATREYATQRADEMKKKLAAMDEEILKHLQIKKTIGPSGRNIFEERYVDFANMLAHKQQKVDELNRQIMIARSFPKPDFNPELSERKHRIEMLEREKDKWVRALKGVRRTARRFDNDPAARNYAAQLGEILDELDELKSIKTQIPSDPTAMLLESCNRELEEAQSQHEANLIRMQESMPDHQKPSGRG